jgi:hypothetical protein
LASQSAATEVRAQLAEVRAQQAEAQVQQLNDRLIAVLQSSSWFVTKPLRAFIRFIEGDFLPFQQIIQSIKLKAKIMLQPLLGDLINIFFYNEKMRAQISPWIKRSPWLRQRLLKVGVNTGVLPPLPHNFFVPQHPTNRQEVALPKELRDLAPRTRRIYLDLKVAIDRKNKEHDKCGL